VEEEEEEVATMDFLVDVSCKLQGSRKRGQNRARALAADWPPHFELRSGLVYESTSS